MKLTLSFNPSFAQYHWATNCSLTSLPVRCLGRKSDGCAFFMHLLFAHAVASADVSQSTSLDAVNALRGSTLVHFNE